jgi:hypothetical protein
MLRSLCCVLVLFSFYFGFYFQSDIFQLVMWFLNWWFFGFVVMWLMISQLVIFQIFFSSGFFINIGENLISYRYLHVLNLMLDLLIVECIAPMGFCCFIWVAFYCLSLRISIWFYSFFLPFTLLFSISKFDVVFTSSFFTFYCCIWELLFMWLGVQRCVYKQLMVMKLR